MLVCGGGAARVTSGGLLLVGVREGRLKIRRGLGTSGVGGVGVEVGLSAGEARMYER